MNLTEIFRSVWNNPTILTILALLFAPVFGCVLMSLDRKITARMQGRMGPPWLQPFYDLCKLFGKQPLALHRPQIMYAVLHLVFMMLVVVLLVQGQDLLMVLFVQAFSVICLVLGGMSVRSPYSWIGSQRKILQMLAYEPVLVLLILAVNLRDSSFLASKVMENPQPLLFSMPLLFLAFLCVVAIEFQKSPFDVATSHHAHQEMVRGITTELSGNILALVTLSHWYENVFLLGVVGLFIINSSWVSIPAAILVCLAAFLLETLIDNVFPRVKWQEMLKWTWIVTLAAGGINLMIVMLI